ncbi:hypothetical protein NC981_20060 [Leptolyngbya sp. DQ-M1]|uniref:hypothetical protein n=1 Tax=Leptolyngbya sp. DQ-M1 TaxID=2933920 RepID=UPI003297593D
MSKRFTKQVTGNLPSRMLILCVGAFTLWLSGCTTGEETATVNPSPAANPSTPAQAFAKPTVPAKDAAKLEGAQSGNKIAGLLQSTDPLERAKQVQRGISSGKDPFSSVPPLVSFKVPVAPPSTAQPTGSTPTPQPPVKSEPRNRPTVTLPKPEPQSPIRPLPPLPDSSLAKGVQITGVVVVGGVPQVIVQAPNEATSRYVQVGQRIANGQVLIKRVEMNSGSEPIVILEQNGVEVARSVGGSGTQPTAALLTVRLFG